ncbi:hypothetical protein [Streptococcus anginosus]|uniref:hypothetical protein n=1 Tax=Streptococcus anginosus TaxID=1328 RepID=UPI0022E7CF74|nr:hypothetical protein [Streptococcus anginosus]
MKKQIFLVVILFVVLVTIDYLNILNIKKIDLNFFVGLLNIVCIIILFLISYHTLDRISKEKEKNKREIASILASDTYNQISFMIDRILTDDIVKNNIVPKIDFNAYGEHEIITNLKKEPFKNERQLYSLIADGQFNEKDFLEYLKIKNLYFSYLTMRIIFFDNPEYYEPIKEELLGKLKKSLF